MRINKFLAVIFGMSIFLWQCAENPLGAGMENEVEIEILGSQFNPSSITIDVGTRVVWVNKDNEIHSIDPGTFMNGTNDFLASQNMEENDTYGITFSNRETINYYCSIHQAGILKQGTIIVQ